MTAKKRHEIITRALALLAAGLLPDALVALLMDEYGLTRARARALAAAAVRKWRAGPEAGE
jgi:hypothetical protein